MKFILINIMLYLGVSKKTKKKLIKPRKPKKITKKTKS